MKARRLALVASLLASCVHDQPTGMQRAPELIFTVAPHDLTVGDPVAIEVTVYDSSRNAPADYDGTITIALGQHPDSSYVFGDSTAALKSGVATAQFFLLRPGQYTLKASAGSRLTPVESAPFTVRASPSDPARPQVPGRLKVFVSPMSDTALGRVLTPAVQVTALDTFGFLFQTDTIKITLALIGGSDAILHGTRTIKVRGSAAVFRDLAITMVGGYRLRASSPGFASDSTAPFTVGYIGPAAGGKLMFGAQPAPTMVGARILSQIFPPSYPRGVTEVIVPSAGVLDSAGQRAAYSGPVTIALGSHPPGAILSGTLIKPPNAAASFPDLRINTAGSGYTLIVSAPGVASATSAPFDILPPTTSAAVRLAFSGGPPLDEYTGALAQVGVVLPALEFDALDDNWGCCTNYGGLLPSNVVTSYSGTVSVTLDGDASGATLSGTRTVQAVQGRARFTDLVIDKQGAYRIKATAGDLPGAVTWGFPVVAPPPASVGGH